MLHSAIRETLWRLAAFINRADMRGARSHNTRALLFLAAMNAAALWAILWGIKEGRRPLRSPSGSKGKKAYAFFDFLSATLDCSKNTHRSSNSCNNYNNNSAQPRRAFSSPSRTKTCSFFLYLVIQKQLAFY